MQLSTTEQLATVNAHQWDTLADGHTCISHGYLNALERSGAVGMEQGWQPHHLLGHDHPTGQLQAAMPLYLKNHSYGEFVFDFAWAEAMQRAGLRYYPKLVSTTPFAPVTGPKLLSQSPEQYVTLLQGCEALAETLFCSSAHCLFLTPAQALQAAANGWLLRLDCHFRWFNRGYGNFSDFLGALKADRRKKIRQERQRLNTSTLQFIWQAADTLNDADLHSLHQLYCQPYHDRGQHPYLDLNAFCHLATGLGERQQFLSVFDGSQRVAMAMFILSSAGLHGRHWGCLPDYHGLHFETCYYQGIDHCISNQLASFDPGIQGEYKHRRGFEPVLTYSAHHLRHPGLRQAVKQHLRQERDFIIQRQQQLQTRSPFKAVTGAQPT